MIKPGVYELPKVAEGSVPRKSKITSRRLKFDIRTQSMIQLHLSLYGKYLVINLIVTVPSRQCTTEYVYAVKLFNDLALYNIYRVLKNKYLPLVNIS